MKAKPVSGRETTTAASLVQHLSMDVAEDDLETVVSLLSDALDLAKAKMRDASKTRAPVDGPNEPDYWLG